MKKKVFFAILASLLIGIQSVNAASTCSYSEQIELNQIAATVKANYEIETYGTGIFGDLENPDEGENNNTIEIYADAIIMNVLNITEDIYVEIKIANYKDVMTFYYSDTKNGVIELGDEFLTKIKTYIITIYSNNSNCLGDKLRTFEFVTPRFNEYSEYGVCELIPDFYYCQKYIVTDINISEDEFVRLSNQKLEEQTKTEEENKKNENNEGILNNIFSFISDNKYIILIVVIVIIGGTTTAIILKNRRSKEL